MSTYVNALAKKFGLKKKDASKSISVEVSGWDVRKAVRKDSSSCALAKACCRGLPGIQGAIFFRSSAWLLSDGCLYRYVLPPKAIDQIKAFDRSGQFKQGTYVLLAPTKSRTLGKISERSRKRPGRHQPGSTSIRRKPVHHSDEVRSAGMPSLPVGFIPGKSFSAK